ncbi:MAG: HlyD family efflux transporter periplasmic adaptor subunit [Planctomycetota bacterium]|nr:HlyD family efflux transporter periplasmic adaptor subunit [Planctomycetota bacterium]
MAERDYKVAIGRGAPQDVKLIFDGTWRARSGSREMDVRIDSVDEDGHVKATVDGVLMQLRLEESADGTRRLVSAGADSALHVQVEVRSSGALALDGAGPATPEIAHDPVVRAPITGVVLSLRVAVGDTVVAGYPVAVLEAMKMETELRSNIDGVVAALPAQPGDRVRTGDPIVEVAPARSAKASS